MVMSEGVRNQLRTLSIEVGGFKEWDADKEAQDFQKLREPPSGFSVANYDKIVTFFLLRLRGNEPIAVRPVMKGIFGKGQVKCPSTVGVHNYTCVANGPFVGRNTSLLYFRPFVLATGKAVLLRFQHEGMLLLLTKKSPMAPLPSLWIVLLPVRGPTPIMQQYGVEQVDWNKRVQLVPPKSFLLRNKTVEKQQPKVGVPE